MCSYVRNSEDCQNQKQYCGVQNSTGAGLSLFSRSLCHRNEVEQATSYLHGPFLKSKWHTESVP